MGEIEKGWRSSDKCGTEEVEMQTIYLFDLLGTTSMYYM
jgi:hypothetical protein